MNLFFPMKYLGPIVVPDDYDPGTLKSTRRLVPGETLYVMIYTSIDGTTTQERIDFLREKNALLVGDPGLIFLWEEHYDLFPRDYRYTSLDHEDRLKNYTDGNRIMHLNVEYNGRRTLFPWKLKQCWQRHDAFLGFFEQPVEDIPCFIPSIHDTSGKGPNPQLPLGHGLQ